MRFSTLALGTLIFLGLGCSSANKKIDEFADRACACPDAECGAQVKKEFHAWALEHKDARGDQDQAMKSRARMDDCISKLKPAKKMDGEKKADGEKKMDGEKKAE